MASVISPLAATMPPGLDPTKLHLAYGRRAIPKLVNELGVDIKNPAVTGDLYVRQKSLASLSTLLRNPENVSQALHADLVQRLKSLIIFEDLTVRQKSTELLVHFAGHAIGRSAIVNEKDLLTTLSLLFSDPDLLVRTNAHQVFVRVTSQKTSVLALAKFQEESRPLPSAAILNTTKIRDVPEQPTTGFVPVLVAKAANETCEIQCLALTSLYGLIRFHEGFAVEALQVKGVSAFTGLLRPAQQQQSPWALKVAAARALMALCFYSDGKRIACAEGTIPVLVALLADSKSEVKAAAAGALMSITVDIDGKRIMVRESLYKPLISLLDDASDTVKLNVIKTITNCSEDYRGRFAFQGCIPKLEAFAGISGDSQSSQPSSGQLASAQERRLKEELREAAKKAIEVITWRP